MDWISIITLLLIAIVIWILFYFIVIGLYKLIGWKLTRRYKPEIDTSREPDLFRKAKNGRTGEIKSDIAG